jgi:hypothetical protein
VFLGAGGVRPIGRLSYFYNRDRVREAIEAALGEITNSAKRDQLHSEGGPLVEIEGGIDIHLVGSLCGGTGAGIFLDLAFDLRRWAQAYRKGGVTMTGHLVLPEAFYNKPVVMRALEANAYVALQELDRYMNAQPADRWQVEYTPGKIETSDRAPFDFCYLLSGAHGSGSIDIETLTATTGQFIAVSTVCEAGHNVATGLRNALSQRLTTQDNKGRSCCYSSYGVVALEVPDEALTRCFGSILVQRTIETLLGAALKSQPHRSDASEAEIALLIGELSAILRKPTASVTPPDVDLGSFDILADEKRVEDAAGELARILTVKQKEWRGEHDASNSLPWPGTEIQEHVRVKLAALLANEGGLDQIGLYLSGCITVLQNHHDDAQRLAEATADNASAIANATDCLKSLNFDGMTVSDMRKAEQKWREMLRDERQASIFQEYARLVGRFVAEFEARFLNRWKELHLLFQQIPTIRDSPKLEYFVANRGRRIACPLEFLVKLLGRHSKAMTAEVLETLARYVDTWNTPTYLELHRRLIDLCASVIQRFKTANPTAWPNCDEALRGYHSCYDKYLERVEVLYRDASALWEVHPGYSQRGNVQEIACIGATEDSHIFGALRIGNAHLQCSSEQRPDFLPIIRTEHGLSLVGLKRMPDYRASFFASILQEQRWDFHFFLDQRSAEQMEFPDEDDETLRLYQAFSMTEKAEYLVGGKEEEYRWLSEAKDKNIRLVAGEPPNEHKHRRAAFEYVREHAELRNELINAFDKLKCPTKKEMIAEWIEKLRKRVSEELRKPEVRGAVRGEVILKQDVFQVHSEIRALRELLKVTAQGL